jgi:hypothetical protein
MDREGPAAALPAVIKLRYAGRCRCGESVAKGERAGYVRGERRVVCLHCLADQQAGRVDLGALAAEVAVPPLPGVAGGAARREYERRVAKRADRLAQSGRLARFSAAVVGEPQSTRAWAVGAVGEERVAARLHAAADRGVLALHDRRIPGSRANIDHIAIGPAGVCVIDAKRYANAQIRVRRVGGLFTRRRDELLVRGRVRNDLVAGLDKQVAAVRAALEAGGHGDVPVVGVLCFVDGLFPLFERGFRVGDRLVVSPRKLAQVVAIPGPITEDERYDLYCVLGDRLPGMT